MSDDARLSELIESDERDKIENNFFQQYTEEQRRNIYGGRAPGKPLDAGPPRVGWVPRAKPKEVVGPLTVSRPSDDAIDRLIERDNNAMLGGVHRFAELPPASRAELYCGTSSALQATKDSDTRAVIPLSLKKKNMEREGKFSHLSNYPLDGIRDARTEDNLFHEYECMKREQYVLDVIAEEGSEDNSEGEEDEDISRARAEAKAVIEKEKKRKDLYEMVRNKKKTQPGDRQRDFPQDFSYSNSKLPGPYFTVNQKGEFTRFEALHNRFHMYRTPQRVWLRNQERLEEQKEGDALPALNSDLPKKKKTNLDAIHENGETERLRRWKHQMGLEE